MNNRVAIVVASVDSWIDAGPSVLRFAEEVQGRGEVILVGTCETGDSLRGVPSIRILKRPSGMLAPELWRDGLLASDAAFVAFSTTAMIPDPGWLDAMLARWEETGAAGIGGPILTARDLSPSDRAVYLLRYLNYYNLSPSMIEPPGDNALYQRNLLEGLEALIDRGFWEYEIHRGLRARGEILSIAENAQVSYRGRGRLWPTLCQRARHAAIYGQMRSTSTSTIKKLARTGAAMLVPALLLLRVVALMKRNRMEMRPWFVALPSFVLLSTAWAAGEATGQWWPLKRSASPDRPQAVMSVQAEAQTSECIHQ